MTFFPIPSYYWSDFPYSFPLMILFSLLIPISDFFFLFILINDLIFPVPSH